MSLPLIGITASRSSPESGSVICVKETYVKAILRAGGIPLLIPPGVSENDCESLLSRLDGLLLSGGGDIDPVYFGGTPHSKVYGIIPDRDELEIGLVKLAASRGFPFLGICRGIQVINVALGGTLFTHIADQLPQALKHDNDNYAFIAHPVRVKPGSQLARILSATEVETNSLHHQGVDCLAPSLTPVAISSDSLVEAVELPGHPFGLGVQWHPEGMPDSIQMQALFRAFVEAAGKL
jgi:putative glutamine amidotransferase